jgi:hypothetical protein
VTGPTVSLLELIRPGVAVTVDMGWVLTTMPRTLDERRRATMKNFIFCFSFDLFLFFFFFFFWEKKKTKKGKNQNKNKKKRKTKKKSIPKKPKKDEKKRENRKKNGLPTSARHVPGLSRGAWR